MSKDVNVCVRSMFCSNNFTCQSVNCTEPLHNSTTYKVKTHTTQHYTATQMIVLQQ